MEDGNANSSLSLIVAMDENGLIGRNGDLPWRLPNDLKHFKATTMGKTMLMGRKTWESLGRPLPGRENWVVSRRPGYQTEGARRFESIDDALASHVAGELMVIGGAQIYEQALPLADKIYLTRVLTALSPADGDVRFPDPQLAGFDCLASEAHPADDRHLHAYRFETLRRTQR